MLSAAMTRTNSLFLKLLFTSFLPVCSAPLCIPVLLLGDLYSHQGKARHGEHCLLSPYLPLSPPSLPLSILSTSIPSISPSLPLPPPCLHQK